MSTKKYIDDNALLYIWNKIKAAFYQKPGTGIPSTDLSSAVQTSLGKADSALQSFTETDPTVPSWAKASTKPSYTAQEVGALPDSTTIPSALSDLSDDSTHRVVTDTEKSTWNSKVSISDMNTAISNALIGGFQTVAELPEASASTLGKIYLVPNSGSSTNVKDEYITVQSNNTYVWELLGTTQLDLSGYVLASDLVVLSNAEIDTILV